MAEPYILDVPLESRFRDGGGAPDRVVTITEVTLRDGTVKDLLVTDAQVGHTAKTIALIAQLSGLERRQVGEMDALDFAVLRARAYREPADVPEFMGGGAAIPLSEPLLVTTGEGEAAVTETISSITLRRGKAKDGVAMEATVGRVNQTLALVAAMSGYRPVDLQALSADDFFKLGERVWGFTD